MINGNPSTVDVATIIRSAGSLWNFPGRCTDFKKIELSTGTKCRKGIASDFATQDSTLISSTSPSLLTNWATSQTLIDEMKTAAARVASPITRWALRDSVEVPLTHPIPTHGCPARSLKCFPIVFSHWLGRLLITLDGSAQRRQPNLRVLGVRDNLQHRLAAIGDDNGLTRLLYLAKKTSTHGA